MSYIRFNKSNRFNLERPIRIIPLEGVTTLSLVTTGDYIIAQSPIPSAPRIRSITLADTGKAVLSSSPMGANRTLKITLACEEASKEEFLRQVEKVWNKMANEVM